MRIQLLTTLKKIEDYIVVSILMTLGDCRTF